MSWNISLFKFLYLLLLFHLAFVVVPSYILLRCYIFNHYLLLHRLNGFVYFFHLRQLSCYTLFSFNFICILSNVIFAHLIHLYCCSLSLHFFKSLFSLPFRLSFISVSLSNLFGEEGEYLFQNVFFAIKLIFSFDFKTKYQHFHVNSKPNTIYSMSLKFLGLVVVSTKGALCRIG